MLTFNRGWLTETGSLRSPAVQIAHMPILRGSRRSGHFEEGTDNVLTFLEGPSTPLSFCIESGALRAARCIHLSVLLRLRIGTNLRRLKRNSTKTLDFSGRSSFFFRWHSNEWEGAVYRRRSIGSLSSCCVTNYSSSTGQSDTTHISLILPLFLPPKPNRFSHANIRETRIFVVFFSTNDVKSRQI